MPQAANAKTVNPPPPDWQKALEIIQTRVHGIESEQRSLSADAKDVWDDVERLGVNKKGAQLFSKILKKPIEKRQDELRTFLNLARQANLLDDLDDLVSRAEAPVAPAVAKAPEAPKPVVPDHPADDSDLAAGPEPAKPANGKAPKPAAKKTVATGAKPARNRDQAMKQARDHLRVVP